MMVKRRWTRVLVVTLAGVVAGSVGYAASFKAGGSFLGWFGFPFIGVVFAVLVLGTAAWLYRDRIERVRWWKWLAAGGYLALGMPAAFFSGFLPLFLYRGLQQAGYKALQHNQYVYVAIILMYLIPCLVWSCALALALSENFFEKRRFWRILMTSIVWISGWFGFSTVFLGVELAVLNRNDSDLVLFIGLEAISAMLIGYYLEKYGVGEASGSAALVGDSSDVDGRKPRFEILAGGTVIGYSELEHGDPSMGVALGRFCPLPAYESIQPEVIAAREGSQEGLDLAVRVAGGSVIPAQGPVRIDDYSAELGADGLEVDVTGIPYPLYEELFPGRHAEYEKSFKKRKGDL